jgi:hypothetical protein
MTAIRQYTEPNLMKLSCPEHVVCPRSLPKGVFCDCGATGPPEVPIIRAQHGPPSPLVTTSPHPYGAIKMCGKSPKNLGFTHEKSPKIVKNPQNPALNPPPDPPLPTCPRTPRKPRKSRKITKNHENRPKTPPQGPPRNEKTPPKPSRLYINASK